MPPSLFKPSAFRALTSFSSSATPSASRLFSSTPVVSLSPPRHTTPTTTPHRLGTIMKDRNAAPRPSTSGNDAAERMLARHRARLVEQRQTQLETAEKVKEKKIARDLIRQMPRRWQAGDVYAPHDLSSVEMRKWKKKSGRAGDLVDALNLSPLDLYKNFSLVRHFTSSAGQILHSRETKLRPVNQRKIAKMIRRVQGMGLYPSIHAHPEMIRSDFFPNHRY
ncbi:hypothetical protein NLU13_5700 [Sarocladium strictum]|uniref:Small ribosomal subunit protein bS18m n=1 Tax=Sarocladium strictum TaxID=5046 RepID=A0AA39GIR7_SARSR|nr:hypothetical protein NLU13_5700 [Sarocladium strictum]